MTEKEQKIIGLVYKKYTDGWWDSEKALRFSSSLFTFVEPEDKIRDALKALSCKKDKDEKYRSGKSALEFGENSHHMFREIEHLMERYESRYRKGGERSETKDIMMMLLPSLITQKGSVTVSLDVNDFTKMIYKECEKCPIREICKEAFPVLSEYVGKALVTLDFKTTSNDE